MSVIIASTMLSAIAPNIMAFTRAATAASQLFSLIDRESKINPFDVGGGAPENVTGAVELQGVNFTYPTRPGTKVLDDFSLHIPAGKVTALVVSFFILQNACYRLNKWHFAGRQWIRKEHSRWPLRTVVQSQQRVDYAGRGSD